MTPTNTPEAARLAEELLPCPFCGHIGLDFRDGNTHRWGIAECDECGASAGETRREYPDTGAWHAKAIKQWNTRAKQDAAPTSASTQTPALKRHALEAAKALSEYAAAPFFPDTEKRGKVRATTADWWDGLAELIEEAQPLIARALRECTEPLARNPGACSVTDGEAKK